MGAGGRTWETVTRQGTGERRAEGWDGNIYRRGPTVRQRTVRARAFRKGCKVGGGEWTEDVGEEMKGGVRGGGRQRYRLWPHPH